MEKTSWMMLHGFTEDPTIIKYDENLRDINKILKKTICLSPSYFDQMRITQAIKKSKSFYQQIGLEISKIKFVKEKTMDEIQRKQHDLSDKELVSLISSKTKQISPFDLPIKIDGTEYSYNKIIETIVNPNNSELLYDMDIIYNAIAVSKVTTLSTYTYTREIAKTQLPKESVEQYANQEVLPIFLELLCAYKNDPKGETLKYLLNDELIKLYESIYQLDNYYNNPNNYLNKYKAVEYTKKIVSIINALNLFIYYCQTTNREKKDIISIINIIFKGKVQLEDLLSSLSINYQENSPKLINRITEYYGR